MHQKQAMDHQISCCIGVAYRMLFWVVFLACVPLTNAACETGWRRHHRKCYLFKPEVMVTGNEANTTCTDAGAHLMEAISTEEYDFVTDYLLQNFKGTGSQFWIGLFYTGDPSIVDNSWVTPAMFRWGGGCSGVPNIWTALEPNGFRDADNCVRFTEEGAVFKMADKACASGAYGYICEKPDPNLGSLISSYASRTPSAQFSVTSLLSPLHGRLDCAARCLRDPGCAAFTFVGETGACSLLGEACTGDGGLVGMEVFRML